MSILFTNIYKNYFQPTEPVAIPTDELDETGEFLLIPLVETIAQTTIQTLAQSQASRVIAQETQTALQSRTQSQEEDGDLDLSTSTPAMDRSTTSTPSSSQVLQKQNTAAATNSPSPSSESATRAYKPYIFERTSAWQTIQLGDDPNLRIEGPDLEEDILIRHGDLSLSIHTSDRGSYSIQVQSRRIDVQFKEHL